MLNVQNAFSSIMNGYGAAVHSANVEFGFKMKRLSPLNTRLACTNRLRKSDGYGKMLPEDTLSGNECCDISEMDLPKWLSNVR